MGWKEHVPFKDKIARCRTWCRELLLSAWRAVPVPGEHRCAIPLTSQNRVTIVSRYILLGCFLLVVLVAILCKMWVIQIREHQSHLKDANRILGFQQYLIGSRGEIFDKDNNLLAGNIRSRDVYIVPVLIVGSDRDMAKLEEVAGFLAPLLDLDTKTFIDKSQHLLANRTPFTVAENVMPKIARKFQEASLPATVIRPARDFKDNGLYDIVFMPEDIMDSNRRDVVVMEIADILVQDPKPLFYEVNRILRRQAPLLIKRNVSLDRAKEIRTLFDEWNVLKRDSRGRVTKRKVPSASFYYEYSNTRFYPRQRLLANLLGFCNSDNTGISGIEMLMDKEMQNTIARRFVTLDGNVRPSDMQHYVYDETLNGANVHLTIQLPIQQVVESALEKLVETHRPKKAYAVMMDPRTGAIMALAQYPNFDASVPPLGNENRSFHALYNTYEPGSIMKAVSVSSAMDYAHLTPDTVVFCENGRWRYGGGKPLGEHGTARFGDLTLLQVIQKSSNIGSAKAVIENMSDAVFYDYLRAYGMGQQTRMGFYPPNGTPRYFLTESPGQLRSVDKWYKIDISRIAIGHTINITPFQMVQAYGAIANRGEMMQPYIIDRIEKADGTVVHSIPFKKGQPISEDTARKIIQCMCATVAKGGTATSAALKEYQVAGKTGTATKLVKVNGKWRYDGRYNTASFAGLVPAEEPAFVLLVTADEPSGKFQYGGSVCGATFRNIAEETLKILQVPPSFPPETDSQP